MTITLQPLIGCTNNKMNIYLEKLIEEQENIDKAIKTVRELMRQSSTIKNTAKLNELTHLEAIIPNNTRWTGT